MNEENLYDTGLQEGESWEGGFPSELIPELQELGFDNPKDDLGEEGLRGFAQLRGDWGGDFVGNMKAIKETLALLPPEVQAKYKKQPQLLNSPAFLKDVAKILKSYQGEQELRKERQKDSLKFDGMKEVQRIVDLKIMQDKINHLLFEHESRMASKEFGGGQW